MRALFTNVQAAEADISPVFRADSSALARPAWSSRPELPAGEEFESEVSDPGADAVAAAHAEGVAEGRAAAAREVEQLKARLEAALADAVGLREKVLAESEEDLVRLSLLIAETLVAGSDPAREGFARSMMKQSMALMKQADSVTVRVNPADKSAVAGLATEAGPATKFVEDPAVSRGGMIIESQLGRVDATLKRAVADVARGLGLDLDGETAGH